MRGKRTPAEICADCSCPDPGWASLNRGVLICDECCSVHRSLGRHISQIRSLHHGPQWPRSLYEMVHALVSNGANSIWEHSLLDPSQVRSGKRKPNPKDPLHPFKSDFIRAKYSRLDFVHRLKDEDTVDLSKQLHSSVRTGNLETCLRLLSLGAQANFFHVERGNTPLHVASKEGQALQCELLMTYGADPGSLDTNGQTPADLARESGHLDLAERLTHSQYELTDRLTFFVCGKRPDHSNISQHFLIPEMADSSLDRSEAAEQARKKLQALSNHLFEELAMDVYDEVDRRELDAIWSSLQKPSLGGGDRTVPFLPLNPELSSTRNQGRQKLARFSAREFATLIIDILKEARRRQQGTMSLNRGVEKEIIDVHREPPKPPAHNKDKNSSMDDNEPLYDSVASDEDYGDYGDLADVKTPTESDPASQESAGSGKDKRTESAASSDLSDGPITLEEYLEVKKQLAASEAKVQQLLAMNKQLNQDVHMLQSMVDSLKEDNSKLLAEQRQAGFDQLTEVLTELTGSLEHVDKLKEENTQLRTEQRQAGASQKSRDLESVQTTSQTNNNRPGRGAGRPMSMFEPRASQKPFPIPTPKELMAGLPGRLPVIKDNEKSNDNTDQSERPPSQAESDYDNTLGQGQEQGSNQSADGATSSGTPPGTPAAGGASGDSEGTPEKRPSQEDVVGATERVTKRIQTLLLAAQECKLERFDPCSGDILSAVKEMATLFPEKPRSERVRQPLRTLVSSASRLQVICRNAMPSDPKVTPDHQHLTQQIISCAYEIAKAAKELVTCYQ